MNLAYRCVLYDAHKVSKREKLKDYRPKANALLFATDPSSLHLAQPSLGIYTPPLYLYVNSWD